MECNESEKNKPNNSEQVEFLEFLTKIWLGRLIIGMFIGAALILASLYLHFSKERWTSVALLTQPSAAEVASYVSAMNTIHGANFINVDDIQRMLLERFKTSISALSEMGGSQFGKQLKFSTVIIDTVQAATRGSDLYIDSAQPIKVTMVDDTAEKARESLLAAVDKANGDTVEDLRDSAGLLLRERINILNNGLLVEKNKSEQNKIKQIENIEYAINVAKQLNIAHSQANAGININSDALFMLGSNTLNTLLKNEKLKPVVYTDKYNEIHQCLLHLSGVGVAELDFKAYRYIMKPSLPDSRDSPKKSAVFIFALLIGFVSGTVFVLTKNSIKMYMPKNN